MAFFRFAYNQSEKGLGKAFLYTMLLGLIVAISVLVVVVKTFSRLEYSEIVNIGNETGCKIVNYQLTCNEDNYEYEGIIIDLNKDDDTSSDKNIILTRNKIISQDDRMITYKNLLTMFNQGPDYEINDFIDSLKGLVILIYIFSFVGTFIGATIFFFIANTLLALVMMLLFKKFMNVNLVYDQMFKLTIYTITPYVILNALLLMIFDKSLVDLVIPNVAYVGGLIDILFDYTIIFGLTYLAIKSRNEGLQEESST